MIIATNEAEERFARILLCIVIILVAGRLVGMLFKRLKLPVVIGEILVGIALGPSLFGAVAPDASEQLFDGVVPFLKVVAQVGLILFMFIVGLEVDLDVVRRSGSRALAISLTSITLPFVLGFFVLGPLLPSDTRCVAVPVAEFATDNTECTSKEVRDQIADGAAAQSSGSESGDAELIGRRIPYTPYAMFIGVAMCGTAFAVLARILAERNMFRIPLGLLLVACAAIDDIVAFTLLALSTAVAGGGSAAGVAYMMLALAIFVTVLFVVVRPVIDRLVVEPFRRSGTLAPEHLTILLVGLFASAFVTSKIGVHELIGAFLFGVSIPRRGASSLFHAIAERIEGVSVQLLLPIFFVIAGQGVDLLGLGAGDIAPVLGILTVACIGKFVGGFVAARMTGVPKRQSLAVGTMMNTRGLAELVILQVGREAGVVGDKVYTMLVIMAVVTTAMAGPLLKLVYPDRWLARDIEEADRTRESTATDRIAVIVDDPAAALPMVRLAAIYGGGRTTGVVTLIRLIEAGDLGSLAESLSEMDQLRKVVVEAGLTPNVIARATNDRSRDIVSEVTALAPGAVVIGDEPAELVDGIVRSGADVFEVRRDADVAGGVAVTGGGSNDELAALELAARVALHHGASIALHGSTTTRARRQLRRLGIRVEANERAVEIATAGNTRNAALTVHAGERDRVPLTESLGTWLDANTVIAHASR